MPLLTEEQFLATFGPETQSLDPDAVPPFDFWPYVETIPAADFAGRDCSAAEVDSVYRMSPGRLDHVLINSDDRNVFMVIVLDRVSCIVHGHRLLDLNHEYGLDA